MGNPLGKALFGGTPVPILAIEMSKEAAGDASQISSGGVMLPKLSHLIDVIKTLLFICFRNSRCRKGF